jgi:hypothetical protein
MDDLHEKYARFLDIAKKVVHYGWIPMILFLGMHCRIAHDRRWGFNESRPLSPVGYKNSNPRPSLLRILAPF